MKVAVSSGVGRSAGGLFYAVSSLCKALDAGGTEVSVFGAGQGFCADDRAVWHPVPVETYRAFGPLSSSPGLRRLLAGSGAEVVHQHGIWLDDQWAALQWQKRTGRPVVLSPHGMLDPWAVRNAAWKKRIVGALFANESLRKATCLHALCRSELDAIRAYGLENPVAVIPNGVALPNLFSENLKPRTEKPTLLFLGRIHPKKGLKELIEAWSQTPVGWRLVIAGWDDGGYEQGLRAQAAGLDAIEFVGPKFGQEKEALLRSADAFVLPSFSEGLPMSVLEAWSYGLPVAMTDFCNLPEGFQADAAVRIAPDPESIAQGLAQLAGMTERGRAEMGARGRALVERKFSWPGIAESMRQVYEWCINDGEKPACMDGSDG